MEAKRLAPEELEDAFGELYDDHALYAKALLRNHIAALEAEIAQLKGGSQKIAAITNDAQEDLEFNRSLPTPDQAREISAAILHGYEHGKPGW